MSKVLIIVVTILYLGVAVSFYIEGNKGMTIVFFGYSVANVGLLMAS